MKETSMDIWKSKNTNTGDVQTDGGSLHIGDNYYKSLEYKELLERISEYEEYIESAPTEEKQREYQYKLNDKKKQLEEFEKGVIELAQSFQRISIDTKRLKSAKQYFEDGEYNAARLLLKTELLDENQKSLLKQKTNLEEKNKELRERFRNNSKEYLVAARLANIDSSEKNRFKNAVNLFEKALVSDRSFENIMEFSIYLIEHNYHNRAEPFLLEALSIKRILAKEGATEHLFDLSIILYRLGSLLKVKNNLKKAEIFLEEALEIRKTLADRDPVYLLDMASSSDSLGSLRMLIGKYSLSYKHFNDALSIFSFFTEDKVHFWSNSSSILNSLGILSIKTRKFNEAKHYFEQALELKRKLHLIIPKDFSAPLSYTLNNLGNLHKHLGNFSLSEIYYEEALDKRRKLTKENPQKYLHLVANTLNNFAHLLCLQSRYTRAEDCYKEALSTYRKLATDNKRSWFVELTKTLINMSLFYQKWKKNKKRSIQLVDEAIDILLLDVKSPDSQKNLESALNILENWGIDTAEHLKIKRSE